MLPDADVGMRDVPGTSPGYRTSSYQDLYLIYHKKKENRHSGFAVETDVREATIQSIMNGMYRMEAWDRPMKGLSAYKTDDLERIVGTLGLKSPDGTKKWKKSDMYHAIQAKLVEVF